MKDLVKTQLINRKRTLSRLFAVQCLYQYEFFDRKSDILMIKEELIENYALFDDEQAKSYRGKIDEVFVDDLIKKTANSLDEIDEDIIKYRNNDNLDLVTAQILRVGGAELKFTTDTDFKIIINEYCDIAGYFYEDPKVSFVSSILNKLAIEYKRT